MKKNIFIVALLFISIVLFAYSFIKADEAEKERILAEEKHFEVMQLKKQNEELRREAQAAAEEAKAHLVRAEQAIADCQSQ